MIETKQPEVHLFNSTVYPLESIALAVSAWHSDDFNTHPIEFDAEETRDLVDKGIKAYHRVALEYVDTIWVIKNVSRAFQQQLTRTRLASYSIQSLRVVAKEGFATNGHYTMPANITDWQKRRFHDSMLKIEHNYGRALETGMLVEDARSMLPLCIHSDISMRINLAALTHMLTQRFCVLTQWEYRQVAVQMKAAIASEEGVFRLESLAHLFDAPCVKAKKCPMREEYCGVPIWKLDEKERMDQYANWKPSENVEP